MGGRVDVCSYVSSTDDLLVKNSHFPFIHLPTVMLNAFNQRAGALFPFVFLGSHFIQLFPEPVKRGSIVAWLVFNWY